MGWIGDVSKSLCIGALWVLLIDAWMRFGVALTEPEVGVEREIARKEKCIVIYWTYYQE